MQFGTATSDAIAAYAPTVEIDKNFALDLGKLEWVQFTYELAGDRLNLDILPPGLHPTSPIVATMQIWRARGGAVGEVGLAQLRVTCRSGMRIRAYLVQSVVSGDGADVLTKNFGYGPQRGDVFVRSRSDRVEGRVDVDGRTVFDAALIEPTSTEPDAIQHIANMNPARTPDGALTLLQVDPQFTQATLRRGEQRLASMDNAFWRLKARSMKYPIVGVAGEALVQIPPVTYTTEPFPKQTGT